MIELSWLSSWWRGLDAQTHGALIGAFATMAGAAIAAIAVFIQIGRQARKARDNVRHNEEIKLKLQIYEQVLDACQEAENARRELDSYVQQFLFTLEGARALRAEGLRWMVPEHRYPQYSNLLQEAQAKLSKVTILVEDWRLVDPRLKVFQIAFSAVSFDLLRASDELSRHVMRMFPASMPDDPRRLFPWSLPPDDAIDRLREVFDKFRDPCFTSSAYLMDFRTEMQRLLLGPLFPTHEIENRHPIDPKYKVIELAKWDELIQHFENDTAWGQNKRDVEARAFR